MKPYLNLLLLLLTVGLSISGCSSGQIDSTALCGQWVLKAPENYCDTLNILSDSTYEERITQVKSIADSGFEITYALNVEVTGRWHMAGDTLFIKYNPENINVAFIDSLFTISPTESGADMKALDAISREMKHNLYSIIEETIISTYSQSSQTATPLGRIFLPADSVMQLANGELLLTFQQSKE